MKKSLLSFILQSFVFTAGTLISGALTCWFYNLITYDLLGFSHHEIISFNPVATGIIIFDVSFLAYCWSIR